MENRSAAVTSGKHMPFRISDVIQKEYETLSNNMVTELLVIGGGLAGLTTAYCLTKE